MRANRGPSRALRILVIIGVVVGGLAGLGFIGYLVGNYVVMPILVGKGQEIEVPEVVGMSLEEAVHRLSEQGLESTVDEKRPDSNYIAGTVIEQRPSGGIKVKKGRLVQLVVSTGEELVRVPYLLGLTLDQATNISRRRGFEVAKIDTVQSDSVRPDRIVATNPDPEIRVKRGTRLHLYVSAGPVGKTIPMPNLIDLPLIRARKALEADSLVLGEIRTHQIAGKGGIVLLQSPEAGVLVGAGDTVNLTVGQEP